MTEKQAYVTFKIGLAIYVTVAWALLRGAWTENPSDYFSLWQMVTSGLVSAIIVVVGTYLTYFFDFWESVEYKTYFRYGLYAFFGSMIALVLGWMIVYPFRLLSSIIFG